MAINSFNATFIIGDKQLQCHKFVASFLSPRITQNLLSDPTINSYTFRIYKKGQSNSEEIQQNLHKLILGEQIEITNEDLQQSKSSKIYSIFEIINNLKNDELQEDLLSHIFKLIINEGSDEKTAKNQTNIKEKIERKINQLIQIENFFYNIEENSDDSNHIKEKINLNLQKYLQNEYIDFINEIAENFSIIDENLIIKMNDIIIEDVLKSEELQIENEDSLLKILLKRRSFIEEEKSSLFSNNLLEFVQFEYLSEKGIELFVNEVEFEEINKQVWNKIIQRLILPVNAKSMDNKRYKEESFPFKYDDKNPFNGILKHLTDISKGNIHTNKTIEITCSRACCGKVETIVDFNDSSSRLHIDNKQTPPHWLKIDFKDRKIQISSYLIRVRDDCGRYIRSWRIEISNDGQNWEKIDERENVSELNGQNKMKTFNIEKKHDPFKFIRIITDKHNWSESFGSQGFSIGNLEFFGRLIE